jgi:hypothetical protein
MALKKTICRLIRPKEAGNDDRRRQVRAGVLGTVLLRDAVSD